MSPDEDRAGAGPGRRLVIAARLENLEGVRRWMTEVLESLGFSQQQVFEVNVAMAEALTNVIRHAYGGPSDQRIIVEASWTDDRITICIQDFGQRFDPARHGTPDLDRPAEGGYGIFLMRRFMDEVTYDLSPPVGTILRLVKRRA